MVSATDFAQWLESLIDGSSGRKLTPTQIAAYAGVTASTIVNWRRGAKPKPESLEKLADALNQEYSRLMGLAGYRADVSVAAPLPPAPRPVPPPPVTRDPRTCSAFASQAAGALAALTQQREWQQRHRDAAGGVWDNAWGLVFTRSSGAPLHQGTVREAFAQALRRAGLPATSA